MVKNTYRSPEGEAMSGSVVPCAEAILLLCRRGDRTSTHGHGACVSQTIVEEIADLDLSDIGPAQDVAGDYDGVKAWEHGELTSWDGTKLYWQRWSGEGDRRGRVILMHGYGEHSSRYSHVAVALVRAGYDVAAIDARGHGKSGGKEAHVAMYDEYVLDLERFIDDVEEQWGEEHGPIHVVGHSNGGLIALRYALRNPERVRSFAVTSPFCGFKVHVPGWKATAGRFLSKVVPAFGLPSEIPATALTHRPEVVSLYDRDPLNRKIATARWFTEVKAAQADLLERAGRITHPLLMLVGGSDQIADPEAAKRVYEKSGSKDRRIEVYDTLYHEILNEVEWEDVMRELLVWLREHGEA